MLKFRGAQQLRQRLVFATLSSKAVQISDIRSGDQSPGLRDFEACLLRLLEKVTDGCTVEINETGALQAPASRGLHAPIFGTQGSPASTSAAPSIAHVSPLPWTQLPSPLPWSPQAPPCATGPDSSWAAAASHTTAARPGALASSWSRCCCLRSSLAGCACTRSPHGACRAAWMDGCVNADTALAMQAAPGSVSVHHPVQITAVQAQAPHHVRQTGPSAPRHAHRKLPSKCTR